MLRTAYLEESNKIMCINIMIYCIYFVLYSTINNHYFNSVTLGRLILNMSRNKTFKKEYFFTCTITSFNSASFR